MTRPSSVASISRESQTSREFALQERIGQLITAINSVVLGKQREVRLALCCLLSGGHLLIEDLPGMGKTTLARSLARGLGLDFVRVQFTSDMLPADILGYPVLDPDTRHFEFRQGPVFTQLLLADEINRASPRTQSALLEAMEERQVSVEGQTRPLPKPFFVIATQNPVSMAGTHQLPESQLDRFLLSLRLGYPDPQSERALLLDTSDRAELEVVQCLDSDDLLAFREQANTVYCSEPLLDYAQDLIAGSRSHPAVSLGLSPRAARALIRSARTLACMEGRDHVLPEDLQTLFPAIARHRLLGDAVEQQRGPDTVIEEILRSTDVRY